MSIGTLSVFHSIATRVGNAAQSVGSAIAAAAKQLLRFGSKIKSVVSDATSFASGSEYKAGANTAKTFSGNLKQVEDEQRVLNELAAHLEIANLTMTPAEKQASAPPSDAFRPLRPARPGKAEAPPIPGTRLRPPPKATRTPQPSGVVTQS